MQYEDFIREFIQLLDYWGTWKDSITIMYKNQVYTSGESDQNQKVINRVPSDQERRCMDNRPEGCEIVVELNGALINLFTCGILETQLDELPLSTKSDYYYNHCELQDEFEEQFNPELIRLNPEANGFPSELEFDSADEYEEFMDNELQVERERGEQRFIADLMGTAIFDNELEVEIGELCSKYGMTYDYIDTKLFIGQL